MSPRIFTRLGGGPIITPDDLPIQANAVFDPGAAEVDGEVVLLLGIEDPGGISEIRVARSTNGIDGRRIADKPLLEPDLSEYPVKSGVARMPA